MCIDWTNQASCPNRCMTPPAHRFTAVSAPQGAYPLESPSCSVVLIQTLTERSGGAVFCFAKAVSIRKCCGVVPPLSPCQWLLGQAAKTRSKWRHLDSSPCQGPQALCPTAISCTCPTSDIRTGSGTTCQRMCQALLSGTCINKAAAVPAFLRQKEWAILSDAQRPATEKPQGVRVTIDRQAGCRQSHLQGLTCQSVKRTGMANVPLNRDPQVLQALRPRVQSHLRGRRRGVRSRRSTTFTTASSV